VVRQASCGSYESPFNEAVHKQVTKYLFLGSVGQLLVIAVYLGLNVGLLFGGTSGDINWIAHHVRFAKSGS